MKEVYYLTYAFNYQMFMPAKYSIYSLYRVVVNESIHGSNQSLNKKRQLSYPPLHIVRSKNIYNRANSSRVTLFYGSGSIDTALAELKPMVGQTITIGEWVPKDENKFICYPISHAHIANGKNIDTTQAFEGFKKQFTTADPLLIKFVEPYFNILGHEYSKSINHPQEYIVSALFSENIMKHSQRAQDSIYNIDCIVYPSVGNKFSTTNFAVKREVLNKRFELANATELEVTATNFNEVKGAPVNSINVVKYKNLKQAKRIEDNNIIW